MFWGVFSVFFCVKFGNCKSCLCKRNDKYQLSISIYLVLLTWPSDWRDCSRESLFWAGGMAVARFCSVAKLIHHLLNVFIFGAWTVEINFNKLSLIDYFQLSSCRCDLQPTSFAHQDCRPLWDFHSLLRLQMHQRNILWCKAEGDFFQWLNLFDKSTSCEYGGKKSRFSNILRSVPVSLQSLVQWPYGAGCLLVDTFNA